MKGQKFIHDFEMDIWMDADNIIRMNYVAFIL